MHAVTIVDGRLEWREHPDPEPGVGELLVAVRAAGLNGADLIQLRGLYPAPPGSPPDIPGLELAGLVQAIGPGVSPDRHRRHRQHGDEADGARANSRRSAPTEE